MFGVWHDRPWERSQRTVSLSLSLSAAESLRPVTVTVTLRLSRDHQSRTSRSVREAPTHSHYHHYHLSSSCFGISQTRVLDLDHRSNSDSAGSTTTTTTSFKLVFWDIPDTVTEVTRTLQPPPTTATSFELVFWDIPDTGSRPRSLNCDRATGSNSDSPLAGSHHHHLFRARVLGYPRHRFSIPTLSGRQHPLPPLRLHPQIRLTVSSPS